MSKRDWLIETGYEDSVVFENPNYDDAIVGVDEDGRVIYDYEQMAECLIKEDGMTYDEAVEFIEYNTIRSLPYVQRSPIILHPIVELTYGFHMDSDEKVKFAVDECVNWIRNWFDKNGKGCNAVIGMSGGKDSTIVAALCAKALGPDRVIGVALPDQGQGTNGAEEICNHIGIKYMCLPIDGITNAFNFTLTLNGSSASEQTIQNIPPRVRMAMLYAVAQSNNGRVANTCNLSEDYIGYSTLFGDSAGSFAPIANFTVTELKKIGRELGLPIKWVDKVPDDGLPNSKPDEEKFGFSYETLDTYIRGGAINADTMIKIEEMHEKNKFKTDIIRIPSFDPSYAYNEKMNAEQD
jgi:NAD+ synthase